MEIQYCIPRMHTRNGTVERATQSMKHLLLASMEDDKSLTENVNQALKVMQFTNTYGTEQKLFELHHGRNPRTELTSKIKDGESDWSELSISAPNKPKIPIYVGRDAEGEITNHLVMARTKTEERQLASKTKSPKKKITSSISLQLC